MTDYARASFVAQLRRETFALDAPPPAPERVGAEIEFLPIDAATGRTARIESGDGPLTLPVLRALGRRFGWLERRSEKAGTSELLTPHGGRISFEPGGQIEYAAPPNESLGALISDLRSMAADLEERMAAEGIALLSYGIDPHHSIDDVPLLLTGARYRRMDRHFASIGPHGARMMRQTASIQICVDRGPRPLERWRLLNALAPYLVAIFANSSVYAGEPTGHQSTRRHVWGELDPSRTGLAFDGADPVSGYARFAMHAGAILLGAEGEPVLPFAEHVRRGNAGLEEWRAHLTTLFPEVRPRGYFEVRSTDALDPQWYAAPLVFVAGLVMDSRVARIAAEVTGPPDRALLARAGRCGLADPAIAATSRTLADLAIEGCQAMGDGFIERRDLDVANAYFDRFTRRARSPSSDLPAPVSV